MEIKISESKIKLMERIINARLTPSELEEFTTFVQTMSDKRPQPVESPSAV